MFRLVAFPVRFEESGYLVTGVPHRFCCAFSTEAQAYGVLRRQSDPTLNATQK